MSWSRLTECVSKLTLNSAPVASSCCGWSLTVTAPASTVRVGNVDDDALVTDGDESRQSDHATKPRTITNATSESANEQRRS